jgi:hypothetical protein
MGKQLVIVLLLLSLFSVTLCDLNSGSQDNAIYEKFKKDFGKKTKLGDNSYRITVFMTNIAKIEAHNKNTKKNYTQGINWFTDLTDDEFARMFLTLKVDALSKG